MVNSEDVAAETAAMDATAMRQLVDWQARRIRELEEENQVHHIYRRCVGGSSYSPSDVLQIWKGRLQGLRAQIDGWCGDEAT